MLGNECEEIRKGCARFEPANASAGTHDVHEKQATESRVRSPKSQTQDTQTGASRSHATDLRRSKPEYL